ncbi:MAG: hypothetical protein IT365_11015 [Candidatus Hydrogenedentes bacterium]|nr:hypothetical protein [Candidatus Hydrogenedentota bacterium]
MHAIDTSSRKEQRKFGLTMAVAFAILGGLRFWVKGVPPLWLFGIAAAFLVAGLVVPFALRPVFIAWLKFAEALNWVMTRVLLTLVFYGLITPARFLNQWFGKDPLQRAWQQDRESYWEEPDDQPEDLEAYRNQF